MKRTTAVINLSAIAMLVAILGIGNSVASKYQGIIDNYFTKTTVNYDSTEVKESLTQGKSLAMSIVQEGAVLLKNQNSTLPLTQPKINVFGWGACDNGFLYQGGGSSEGGYSADKISFYEGLRESGFQLNENLCKAYNGLSYRREGAPDSNQFSTYYRTYEPGADFYTKDRMQEAKAFSDTAIMVFSRRATEGDDLPKTQYDENGKEMGGGRNYLALTDKEVTMIQAVTSTFDKVICLFNTSAPMEMGFLDYDGIDAALYVGYPGYYGTRAIGDILNGGTNPSGHLPDTAAYSLASAPSYVNTGNEESHTYSGRGGQYTDYAEDIYVGYRWYETADAEGYWKGTSLDSYGHAKKGYDAVVQYPFGYGLSYTTFDWKLVGVEGPKAGANLGKNDTISYTVQVTNTGKRPGKDVVQLYFESPYTKGGIEKSAVELEDFQKTETIQPGKSDLVVLTLKVSDLSCYDTYDKNNNGFMGYEVEPGDYKVSFRTDSHHVKTMDGKEGRYTYHVTADYQYDKDPDTGAEVKNRFTTYTNKTSGASSKIDEPQATYATSIDGNDANPNYNQGIQYLTRANFKDTFPQHTAIRSSTSDFHKNVTAVHTPTVDASDTMPTTGSTATSLTLDDVKGLPYDDPKWTQLIEQLSVEQIATLSASGGFGTIAIDSIKKPKCQDSDGGTGFTSGVSTGDEGHAIKYPAANVIAASFDYKEAYKWGHAVGSEGKALGIQGWYVPGCNLHRSPLGGRNFEYFSEDPLVCGTFVAYTVKGATENGVYCYMKHFAGNDSDAGRNGQYKWMTEQSLRELYAKPGEIAVKVGKANALMISVDRIGSVRATGSYALLTSLLRGEWGFHGSAITDYYQGGNVNDLDECIRAGTDLALMPNGNYKNMLDDYQSATAVKALQKSAHDILYTYIDTVDRTEKFTGVDFSKTASVVKVLSDGKWWRKALLGIDIGVGVLFLTWGVLVILFTWGPLGKKKKKSE